MDLKKYFLYIENHGYYGFNRRVDEFSDKDGNLYVGVIYILSCIWNGNKSEEGLIIDELENGNLTGDLEFAFMEFTYSNVMDSLIDRNTEDAMDLEFNFAKENKTFPYQKWSEYEGLEQVFVRDIKDYGAALANQYNIKNIEVEIIEMIEKKSKNLI